MKFRFVGIESNIGQLRVNAFGQLLELDPAVAHDCVLGRVPLVPDQGWDKYEFTEDELNEYSTPDAHRHGSTEFNDKKAVVHKAVADYRANYEAAAARGDTFMSRAGKTAPVPPQAPVTGKWPTRQLDPVQGDPLPTPAPTA